MGQTSKSGARLFRVAVSLTITGVGFALLFFLATRAAQREERTAPIAETLPTSVEPGDGDASRGPTPPQVDLPVEVAASAVPGAAGTVVDALTAEPIEGAWVSLSRSPRNARLHEVERAVTGDDGRFDLATALNEGRGWWLRVHHPDFVPWQRSVTSIPPRIELSPGFPLTGEVRDGAGSPVPGGTVEILLAVQVFTNYSATVTARDAPYRYVVTGTHYCVDIGRDGRFRAMVAADCVACEAHCPGYAPAFSRPVFVDPIGGTHVVIEVQPGATLTGRVVDAEGVGVEAVSLAVTGIPDDRDPDRFFLGCAALGYGTTDAQGRFAIPDLPAAYAQVEVSHPEHSSQTIEGPRDTGESLTVTLAPAQWLTGRILDPQGAPLTPTVLSLPTGSETTAIEVGADGRFRSTAFDPTISQLSLCVPGYLPIDLSWEPGPGAHDTGEHTLAVGLTLLVEVTDSAERAVPSARVRATQRREASLGVVHAGDVGSTDDFGRVRLGGLARDTVRLNVSAVGFAGHSGECAVSEDDAPVRVQLRPACSLSGQVVTSTGAPAVLAEVLLTAANGQGEWRGGDVEFTTVTGGFGLQPRAGIPWTIDVRSREGSARVEVTALEPGEQRVLPPIQLRGVTSVAGQVVDDQGWPIAGAIVAARANSHGGVRSREMAVNTGPEGHFELGLVAGDYQLTARAEGYVDAIQELVVDAQPPSRLRVTLAQGRTYSGNVVDEQGAPVSGARVHLFRARVAGDRSVITDSRGAFRVTGLPETDLCGSVTASGFPPVDWGPVILADLPSTIVLRAGATLEIGVSVSSETPVHLAGTMIISWGRTRQTRRDLVVRNGLYRSVGLTPGTATISVTFPGYADLGSHTIELEPNRVTRLDLQLSPTPEEPLPIRVENPSGDPIANATVEIAGPLPRVDPRFRAAQGRTNAEGYYLCGVPIAKGTVIIARASGYGVRWVENPLSQLQDGELRIRLIPASVLIVRVLDDGMPIVGAHVALYAADAWTTSLGDVTDSTGVARINDLTPGVWSLNVRRGRQQLASTSVELRSEEERELRIEVEPEIAVVGRILENGQPVSGGECTLTGSTGDFTANVEATGTFEVMVRGVGEYRVRYRGTDFFAVHEPMQRHIPATGPLTVAFATTSVDLKFVDGGGDPVASASGWISGPTPAGFTTDAGGRATFARLAHGTYRVELNELPDGLCASRRQFVVPADGPVLVTLQEGMLLELDLTLPAGVSARAPSVFIAEAGELTWVPARADGRYSWPTAARDGLVLGVGIAPASFRVPEDPTAPIQLVLREGGHAVITIVGDTGTALANTPFEIEPLEGSALPEPLRTQRTGADGVKKAVLAPGSYRIAVTLGDQPVTRTVTIVAGETVAVTLP